MSLEQWEAGCLQGGRRGVLPQLGSDPLAHLRQQVAVSIPVPQGDKKREGPQKAEVVPPAER